MSAKTAACGSNGDRASGAGGNLDVSIADANMAAPRETKDPSRAELELSDA